MTLCNKSFENARWDFFLLHCCRSTWDCCGFRSPFHPFRCRSSVLKVCPVEAKGGLVAKPRCGISAAVPRAFVAVVLAPATSLAGTWEHQEFSLQTILFWALLQKPSWLGAWCLHDASRTVLMGEGDSRVNQVSVSPDFCYTGLESSWKLLPACVVACGVFLHWLFPCGSTRGAGTQLTKGDSGITSTWKSTNCT